jgi:hypothetical protein
MTDDRGVSTTVNYILGLSIALLLVAGLFVTVGDFVQDQRETSVRTEMEVLGEQIAVDIEAADRLVQSTDDGNVTVRRSLPSQLSGSSYTIAIEGGDDPYLILTSHDPELSTRARFTNTTNVAMTRINGGSIQVNYTDGKLVLEGNDR